MIKQIGLPLRGRPILLITRMITDRIGLHSVLLPLQTLLVINTFHTSLLCTLCFVLEERKALAYIFSKFKPLNTDFFHCPVSVQRGLTVCYIDQGQDGWNFFFPIDREKMSSIKMKKTQGPLW